MVDKVFFSFHYKNIWKINQIKNIEGINVSAAAGFKDATLWKNTRDEDRVFKKMLDDALEGTTVSVFLITLETKFRKYINYEIEKSIERGNALLAIKIHQLKDENGNVSFEGEVPVQIQEKGFKSYNYTNQKDLKLWIEKASELAKK